MEEPIERPSGRVIAVDPEGCVLMFRVEDPADTKPAIWMTPGGGVEPGDSAAEAAVREFFAWRGPRFEPSTLGWSAREHELHAAWRWWDADDLEQSNEAVLPAGVAAVARAIESGSNTGTAVELPWLVFDGHEVGGPPSQ
jgi:hypothetical protein